MATFRGLINSVLRRLREDTIATDWTGVINDSNEEEYTKLVGELINEAKEVVEDAWNWTVLRSTETVTTSAGTSSYVIPNAMERTRVLQVIDNTNNYNIPQMSDADYHTYIYGGTTTNGTAIAYRLSGNNIEFYPPPAGVYDIKVHTVTPQDDLTTAAEVLTVPSNPVVLTAYALAMAERGEDGGTTVETAGVRADSALTDAITQDTNRTVNETVWYVA